ncbi:YncE family protein [Rhizosaccharibacter radicis]|uniref:PQQ-binding-like beta-propeller repeat protein n=1 Tax=Rhizosaccharibacter radicis TaxID=2782605 RepID=A0ABT1VZY5_9PROT|nr:PQQ-binding-like beta-propeller repeat protein [Acetobacteraceae bacterium KSS12]
MVAKSFSAARRARRPVPVLGRAPLPAAGVLALGVLALAAAPADAARIAFVLNSADASISEFDVDSHQLIRKLPVLREPHHLALTPDGRSVAVGDTSGNALFFLDAQTGEMQRHVPISDPYQLSYSPNGKLLTVAGLARNQIDIYDAQTLQLLHRVPAPAMPSHINYAPDSSVVYVSLQDTGKLVAIETATGKVQWTTEVGSTPAGVLWHETPDGGRLLVGVMGTTYVAVVDPVDGRVVRRIEMSPGPHNLFASPSRRELFVTCRVSGMITQLDWDSLNVIKSWHVAGGPDDIVFGPDGKLWATLRWRQKVAILDTATGDVSFIPTGRSPHGIWLNTAVAPKQLSMR